MKKKVSGMKTLEGLEAIKCPGTGCSYILTEVAPEFSKISSRGFECQKCQRKVNSVDFFHRGSDCSKLIIRYVCNHCEEEFDRTVLVMQYYCSNCKAYYQHYSHLLRGLTELQKLDLQNQPPAK